MAKILPPKLQGLTYNGTMGSHAQTLVHSQLPGYSEYSCSSQILLKLTLLLVRSCNDLNEKEELTTCRQVTQLSLTLRYQVTRHPHSQVNPCFHISKSMRTLHGPKEAILTELLCMFLADHRWCIHAFFSGPYS